MALDPAALPDPAHWAILSGLAVLVAFLARVAWKDLHRPDRVPDDAGPDPRVPVFRDTIASLWVVCGTSVASWVVAGGALTTLGFRLGSGGGAPWAWGVAALGSVFLWFQWRTVDRSPEARARYAEQVDGATGLDWVRPTTVSEYRHFNVMAVTAGITEEVIFRGFLIGVLAFWMPLWAAGTVALLVFVGAHVYQGVSGMLRILPVSVILTVLFLVSGSLLPGVLLHAVVDVAGGAILWRLRDERRSEPPTEASEGPTQPIRSHS